MRDGQSIDTTKFLITFMALGSVSPWITLSRKVGCQIFTIMRNELGCSCPRAHRASRAGIKTLR
jgi:hypothetical protein